MGYAEDLVAWFDQNRRDLPWRRTRDPFRIWVSEVMLQQTRAEVVIPYYERFLARFPTVEELARAPVEEVLAAWSGLGYYRRARQLHAAARTLAGSAERQAGGGPVFPASVEGWRALPGVGAYTAAAVASIAFAAPVPVLDGNVARVLSRFLAAQEDPRSRQGREKLLAAAAALLAGGRPGDSNQALMELGATICSPRRPKCPLCPLRNGCRAAGQGDPERFPSPRPRRGSERHRLIVAVVESRGRILLFRRSAGDPLLGGTWELPWVEVETPRGPAPRPEKALADKYGGRWALGPGLGVVRHGITYRDLMVAVHRADLHGGDEVGEGSEAGWFDAGERARLPLGALVGKALAQAGASRPGAARFARPAGDPPASRSRSPLPE